MQPFGHNTPTLQTDGQDRQRSDSIGRTVLQTVAQKCCENSAVTHGNTETTTSSPPSEELNDHAVKRRADRRMCTTVCLSVRLNVCLRVCVTGQTGFTFGRRSGKSRRCGLCRTRRTTAGSVRTACVSERADWRMRCSAQRSGHYLASVHPAMPLCTA